MGKLRVRMATSLGGEDISLVTGQEYDLEEEFAIALVTEPADSPRATPIDWEPPADAVAAAQAKAEAAAEAEAKMRQEQRGVPEGAETMETVTDAGDGGSGGLTREDMGAAGGTATEPATETPKSWAEMDDGNGAGQVSSLEELLAKSRDDLDALARQAGVQEPEKLQNKKLVAEAILAAGAPAS